MTIKVIELWFIAMIWNENGSDRLEVSFCDPQSRRSPLTCNRSVAAQRRNGAMGQYRTRAGLRARSASGIHPTVGVRLPHPLKRRNDAGRK
jgi:hypothetical protein